MRGCAMLALAAVCAIAVGACGVRTDPRPPEDTAARAPEDFEAKVRRDGTVELRWERPTRTVDGGRLYDLAAFMLERRRAAAGFETITTIPVTDTDRLRTQRTFHYVDENPPQGDVEYLVRAVHSDGEVGVPNVVQVSVPSVAEPRESQPSP